MADYKNFLKVVQLMILSLWLWVQAVTVLSRIMLIRQGEGWEGYRGGVQGRGGVGERNKSLPLQADRLGVFGSSVSWNILHVTIVGTREKTTNNIIHQS